MRPEEMLMMHMDESLGFEMPKKSTGIGDVNSKEKGSGARFNSGKPDYSLIPFYTLADEAQVWMYGQKIYCMELDERHALVSAICLHDAPHGCLAGWRGM